MKQGIHESAAIALVFRGTGPGVNHHAGGLVDDSEVGVFVEDVERDIFGDGSQWRPSCLGYDGYALPTSKFQGGSGRSLIHEHFLLGDELLDARAAHIQTECQELIEALAGLFRDDRNRWWRRFGHSQSNGAGSLRAKACIHCGRKWHG
jgi:hypothetical protein